MKKPTMKEFVSIKNKLAFFEKEVSLRDDEALLLSPIYPVFKVNKKKDPKTMTIFKTGALRIESRDMNGDSFHLMDFSCKNMAQFNAYYMSGVKRPLTIKNGDRSMKIIRDIAVMELNDTQFSFFDKDKEIFEGSMHQNRYDIFITTIHETYPTFMGWNVYSGRSVAFADNLK